MTKPQAPVYRGPEAFTRPEDQWRQRAACRDTPGDVQDLFFPLQGEKATRDQCAGALAYCGRCPVVAECLDYALLARSDSGVWGGMTEGERRAERRRRQRRELAAGKRAGGESAA